MTTKRALRAQVDVLQRQNAGLRADLEHWRRRCQQVTAELRETDIPAMRGQNQMLEDDRLRLIARVNELSNAEEFGRFAKEAP